MHKMLQLHQLQLGVNIPERNPPIMITGSINAQTLFLKEKQRSCFVAFENVIKLRRLACHRHKIARQHPIITPGKIPAKNNLVIDTPLATPKDNKRN
ncbi:Uncharacterised protein [Haemophilus influenzae]|uniref:Uncharacterized protein n=1 Tax=Haemophilus influenzae TaxID=727 RepID=A0A2X1PZM6_HAEIF|nr:Uncharacterised protein [Haemophilus influenzae]